MNARCECPRCGKTGYIRAERVIKAGNGMTELVCGACEYSWRELDEAPGKRLVALDGKFDEPA